MMSDEERVRLRHPFRGGFSGLFGIQNTGRPDPSSRTLKGVIDAYNTVVSNADYQLRYEEKPVTRGDAHSPVVFVIQCRSDVIECLKRNFAGVANYREPSKTDGDPALVFGPFGEVVSADLRRDKFLEHLDSVLCAMTGRTQAPTTPQGPAR